MKKLTLLLLLATFMGCATTSNNTVPIQDMQVFQSSFDRTWGAVVATISELGLEIESIEKPSGLLSTKKIVFAGTDAPVQVDKPRTIDEWVYPPSIAAQLLGGGWQKIGYRLSIFVSPVDEKNTKVKITATFDGTTTSGIQHKMSSKGIVESKIFWSIQSKLQ